MVCACYPCHPATNCPMQPGTSLHPVLLNDVSGSRLRLSRPSDAQISSSAQLSTSVSTLASVVDGLTPLSANPRSLLAGRHELLAHGIQNLRGAFRRVWRSFLRRQQPAHIASVVDNSCCAINLVMDGHSKTSLATRIHTRVVPSTQSGAQEGRHTPNARR
jgi:hypothetical protein